MRINKSVPDAVLCTRQSVIPLCVNKRVADSVLCTRQSVIPLCVNKSVPDSVLSTRQCVIPLCVNALCVNVLLWNGYIQQIYERREMKMSCVNSCIAKYYAMQYN